MGTVCAATILAAVLAIDSPQPAIESELGQLAVACDGGAARSCFQLGAMYVRGRGIAQDRAKAEQLFAKACDGAYAPSCLVLGLVYDSVAVFRVSAPDDEVLVEFEHGDMRKPLVVGGLWNGAERPPEQPAQAPGDRLLVAVRYYQKACDGGNATGCHRLATLYSAGNRVAQDKVRAAQLYEKACEAGDADGCAVLGHAYFDGEGILRDRAKALDLSQRACQGGSAAGCYSLVFMYADLASVVSKYAGETEKDLDRLFGEAEPSDSPLFFDEADALFGNRTEIQAACEGGSARGCCLLARMYGAGEGVPLDKAKAAQLCQKACDGGEAVACWFLATMYGAGEGVPQDRAKAAQLYRKACDGGVAAGCREAKKIEK